MPVEEDQYILHFILTVTSVKMKVKFPCKMTLEHNGSSLTHEAPPNEDNRFNFNQEIRIKQESQKLFSEISACLITEKGSKYISGLLKVYHNELIRSEGQRLVISLAKCLDAEAFCEMRVDKVIRERLPPKRVAVQVERTQRMGSRLPQQNELASPEFKSGRRSQLQAGVPETKSQSHFPVNGAKFRKQQQVGLGRRSNLSPKRTRLMNNSKGKGYEFGVEIQKERQKLIQAEVYKENYQKLKQKYMRQAQNSKNQLGRRIALENNQNNYKLEIVRLKLKSEELEKVVAEKNAKIKQFGASLAIYHQRDTDLNYMREELSSREHTIRMLEDSVIALSRQNDEMRVINKEISYKMEEKMLAMQSEIESLTIKSSNKQYEYERQIRNYAENLQQRDQDLGRKNEQLQKQKKNVYELEKNMQNKLYQFDSILQNERTSSKQRIQEIKNRLDEANSTVAKLTQEKGDLNGQLQRLRGLMLKNEYELKLHVQEYTNLKNELDQYKSLKQKYGQISKQLKIVNDQKVSLEKNYEKMIASREINLQDLTTEYKRQVDYYKRTHKQMDQKNKYLSTKLIETQGQLETARATLQKIKKNQENLTKDFTELKEKEKALKKNLKIKEEQYDDSKKQYIRYKQKSQTIIQGLKVEVSRVKQEICKLKIELQSAQMKNEQLLESNAEISMELARLKITQQFAQEKYEKTIQSAQEKYAQFQKIIKEHENVIELLEEKIKVQKSNEKEYYGKIQKTDYELNVVADKNQKIMKELRAIDERRSGLEVHLKARNNQLQEVSRKLSEIEIRFQGSEQSNANLRDELQIQKNELQKSRRIVEILQKDYEKAKNDIVGYIKKLGQKEKELDDQALQLRKERDSFSVLDGKYNNMKKQYDKFKESVGEALNSSFTQVIHSLSPGLQETKTSSMTSMDYSNFGNKRAIPELGNDLVSAIITAGRENKSHLTRITERNKNLERDLQILRGEMQRTQQNIKRADFQKSSQIQELQAELLGLQNDKNELQVHYQSQIHELEQHLRQKQQLLIQSESARNELQFTLSSLSLQIKSSSQDNEKRLLQLRREKKQMEQKMDYHYNTIQKLEKKIYQAETQLMNTNSVLMVEKEQSYKKDIKLEGCLQQKQKLTKQLQSIKRTLKQLQERNSQLDIQLSTTRQIKEKYQSMLNQQEGKLKDLRHFNNNILKQKQENLKKQLQHHQQLTQLQSALSQLRREKQEAEDWKSKLKAQLQQAKQSLRKYLAQSRELQSCVSQEKVRYNEIRDRLRQKQQELVQVRSQAAGLRKRLQQLSGQLKMNANELGEQNNLLNQRLSFLSSQSADTIHTLQIQVARLTQQLQSSRGELGQLQEMIFVQRQNNQSMLQSLTKLRGDLDEYKKKLQEMQHAYEELSQQNRQKDEQMFDMGGRLFQYESRLKEVQDQKARQIQQLSNNLNVKYDQDYQQIYQKIEFIQRQKDYFKEKLEEKEVELARKNQQLKHKQIQDAEIKRILEQKVKRLEQQKLQLFTDKNRQIAKVLQENKGHFQALRSRESENRKSLHQLQISRNTITKLESRVKQLISEKNNQVKVYQVQVENLRKKDLAAKAYRDNVRSNQWAAEREVRKSIQGFMKRVLELGEGRAEGMVPLIKSLEEALILAIGVLGKD